VKQRFDENEEIISNWFMGNKFAKPWRFISHYPVHSSFRQSQPYVTREREREREFLFERETEHLWLRQSRDGAQVIEQHYPTPDFGLSLHRMYLSLLCFVSLFFLLVRAALKLRSHEEDTLK
jgi:hypothetical protein